MDEPSETAQQIIRGLGLPPVTVTPETPLDEVVIATVKDLIPIRYGTLSSLGFANRLATRLRQWRPSHTKEKQCTR